MTVARRFKTVNQITYAAEFLHCGSLLAEKLGLVGQVRCGTLARQLQQIVCNSNMDVLVGPKVEKRGKTQKLSFPL